MKFVPAGYKGTCQQLEGSRWAINEAGKHSEDCRTRTILIVQAQVKGSWGVVGIQIKVERSCAESLLEQALVLMCSVAQQVAERCPKATFREDGVFFGLQNACEASHVLSCMGMANRQGP